MTLLRSAVRAGACSSIGHRSPSCPGTGGGPSLPGPTAGTAQVPRHQVKAVGEDQDESRSSTCHYWGRARARPAGEEAAGQAALTVGSLGEEMLWDVNRRWRSGMAPWSRLALVLGNVSCRWQHTLGCCRTHWPALGFWGPSRGVGQGARPCRRPGRDPRCLGKMRRAPSPRVPASRAWASSFVCSVSARAASPMKVVSSSHNNSHSGACMRKR